MNDAMIEIYLEILHATDRALFVTDGSREDGVWLPKSQISLDFDVEPGDGAEITMPEWLARDKGLI